MKTHQNKLDAYIEIDAQLMQYSLYTVHLELNMQWNVCASGIHLKANYEIKYTF